MPESRAEAHPSGREDLLTIGQVLDALHDEFPDVSGSKLRYLESRGLIAPERTPAGYRLYAAVDLSRIRFVLHAQRDRFWPLKVIAAALDGLDRGLVPDPDDGTPRAPEPRDVPRPGAPVRLTVEELLGGAGLDARTADELLSAGLLHPDADGWYGAEDLEVAHAAALLTAYGIEARHLRPFKAAADREVGLVEQALVGKSGAEAAAEASLIASATARLHSALVRGELGRSGF